MVRIKGTAVQDTIKAIKERAGGTEFEKIAAQLDEQTKNIFLGKISPSAWYPFDAFARFLEVDIKETAGGELFTLIDCGAWIDGSQHVRLQRSHKGLPVIGGDAVVHSDGRGNFRSATHTLRDALHIDTQARYDDSAAIQYVGFAPQHRIIGFVIIGFFRKALEISGAKQIEVHFRVPIEAGERYCELALTWV